MDDIQPRTAALRDALRAATSEAAIRDLLYLEAWEFRPEPGAGAALRINQLRRANPELAAAIRDELRKAPIAVSPLASTPSRPEPALFG